MFWPDILLKNTARPAPPACNKGNFHAFHHTHPHAAVRAPGRQAPSRRPLPPSSALRLPASGRRRARRQTLMFWLLRAVAACNVLALLGVCAFLLRNGLPALSWEFLTQAPRNMMTEGGIWPCIVGTAILSLGSLLLAFPLGVASAVYLHEYAGRSPFARYVRLGVNNLAGVPSVVFGLFGLSFFVTFCGFGVSILSGVLTLAVLTLPVIIGTAEEALRNVPDTYREASLALGGHQVADHRQGGAALRLAGHAYRSHFGGGPCGG